MSLVDLTLLYLIAGLACAVAIYRTWDKGSLGRVSAALLAIPFWPLWAPICLTGSKRSLFSGSDSVFATPNTASHPSPFADHAASNTRGQRPPVAEVALRVEAALREGVEACAGSALEALLSKDAASRIAAEVKRAAARHAELDTLLARNGFDLASAEKRIAKLERDQASPRALATARLHLENIRRLYTLRDRDAQALEELSDLVQALRTQLVLARFAGSSVEGVSGIVSEVWARVEGLGAVMDAQEAPGQDGIQETVQPSTA